MSLKLKFDVADLNTLKVKSFTQPGKKARQFPFDKHLHSVKLYLMIVPNFISLFHPKEERIKSVFTSSFCTLDEFYNIIQVRSQASVSIIHFFLSDLSQIKCSNSESGNTFKWHSQRSTKKSWPWCNISFNLIGFRIWFSTIEGLE